MKRSRITIALISLLVVSCMSLAACSGKTSTSRDPDDDDDETVQTVEDETEASDATEDTEAPVEEGNADFDPDFTFSTTDRDGNTYDESIFAEHELTMINFWEPWCGPCVGEIPELQQLYEDMSPEGFLILGVYSDMGYEEDVDEIINSSKVTYPILHYTSEFDQFQSGYVPTTIFVDRQGHVVTPEGGEALTVGSNSYSDWAAIVEGLL